MVVDELLLTIKTLDVEERRQIFFALLNDPELKINPFDAINIRQNAELASAMLKIMRKDEAEREAAAE